MAGHQLLRCGHGGAHTEARPRDIGVSSGYVVHVVKVLVARGWRLLFKIEVVFALELLLVDVLNKLAVRAGLMCATMPDLR